MGGGQEEGGLHGDQVLRLGLDPPALHQRELVPFPTRHLSSSGDCFTSRFMSYEYSGSDFEMVPLLPIFAAWKIMFEQGHS